MAKVRLAKMIFTETRGPLDGTNWRPGGKYRSIVSKRDPRISTPRHRDPEVDPDLYEGPYPWHCECKAWKAADKCYQGFSDEIRAHLRRINNRPGTSCYDAYMRWAIPHIIRGFPVPPYPNAELGQYQGQLYNPTPNELTDWDGSEIVYPEQACHNFGLAYARAWFIFTPPPWWPEPLDPGAICHYAEAFDFQRPDNGLYWDRAIHWGEEDEEPNINEMDWEPNWKFRCRYIVWTMGHSHFRWQWAPPYRNDDGEVTDEGADVNKVIEITWHGSKYHYAHFPREPGAPRGVPLYLPAGTPNWDMVLPPQFPRIPY